MNRRFVYYSIGLFFNFPHVDIPWMEEATSGWKEMKREDQAGGLDRKKGPCRKRGFSQTPISMREIMDHSHSSLTEEHSYLEFGAASLQPLVLKLFYFYFFLL